MAVWLIGVHAEEPWYYELATVVMFLSFFVGILFLALYYQYFHVKRLSYATNNNPPAGMPYSYVTPNGTYIVSNHVGDHHAYDVMASGKNAYSNSATNPVRHCSCGHGSFEIDYPPLCSLRRTRARSSSRTATRLSPTARASRTFRVCSTAASIRP